jgi:hypothetical protein
MQRSSVNPRLLSYHLTISSNVFARLWRERIPTGGGDVRQSDRIVATSRLMRSNRRRDSYSASLRFEFLRGSPTFPHACQRE